MRGILYGVATEPARNPVFPFSKHLCHATRRHLTVYDTPLESSFNVEWPAKFPNRSDFITHYKLK